jgi:hypothetical protein
MSLGFRDQKEASRRKWRLFRLLFTTAVLLALGVFAYQTGIVLAKREVISLRLVVDRQAAEIVALGDENAELRRQTEAAGLAEADWRKRYETEVPTGKSRELFALVQDQLGKGADPGRIEFLVGTAANKQSCDAVPVTKRFLVRTPLYDGANDASTFADRSIVVVALGESATDAEGNPEAWFDPAKPVVLRFIEPGGGGTEATGLLPLHHSVVRGDSEYRFAITAAERRGFVSVTAERCAFP